MSTMLLLLAGLSAGQPNSDVRFKLQETEKPVYGPVITTNSVIISTAPKWRLMPLESQKKPSEELGWKGLGLRLRYRAIF